MLDSAGGPERFVSRLAQASRRHDARGIILLPPDLRLALEMALHEESERRALEGEMAALVHEWRAAEEVAAIADDLLLPDIIRNRFGTRRDGHDKPVRGVMPS